VKIDINNGKKTLEVPGEPSLLEALSAQGVYLPSSCGGRAICGMCKAQVLSGVTSHLPSELRLLTKDETTTNIHLSCQIKIENDLRIRIPDELFGIKKYRVRVSSIKDLTYDTKELRFQLIEPAVMNFIAGQFVQLVIPPHETITGETIRAYSIASVPVNRSELELIIRRVPAGIATTYVHTRLAVGQEIEIIGPMGDFRLHDDETVMICIAGGSGMPSIKSILFDMYERKKIKPSVWYFFGAVTRRDLFNLEIFYELEQVWPVFHFVPALSAPAPADDWKGETGLITEVVDKFLNDKIDKMTPTTGYLCGSMGMINSAIKMFEQHGISREKVYYDKFV
jgi:Na+-transporting NADH:ubiquinone oxidoreductase subunit F